MYNTMIETHGDVLHATRDDVKRRVSWKFTELYGTF